MPITDKDRETLARLELAEKAGKLNQKGGEVLSRLRIASEADTPGSIAQTVSKYARPALEFGGALAGGVIAAPGGPLATMGGGALGFAAGKSGADLLDRKMGIKPEATMLDAAKETVQNIGEGVATEMTG